MSDRDELHGRWKELWDKIQERWGELTDDEIQVVNGKYEQLVGLIRRRSGEPRERVEKSLGEIARMRRVSVAPGGSKAKQEGERRPESSGGWREDRW